MPNHTWVNCIFYTSEITHTFLDTSCKLLHTSWAAAIYSSNLASLAFWLWYGNSFDKIINLKLTHWFLAVFWSRDCPHFCQRNLYWLWRPSAFDRAFSALCASSQRHPDRCISEPVLAAHRNPPSEVWIHSSVCLAGYRSKTKHSRALSENSIKVFGAWCHCQTLLTSTAGKRTSPEEA